MSIFQSRKPESKRRSEDRQEQGPCIAQLPVERIQPNPDQPRKDFDEGSIGELAASISQVGIIQPLIVRKRGSRFVLIAGERRLRAAKLIGMKKVPCVIETRDERDSALMAIVENLQREDLNFFEEAECYSALLVRHGLTQEELAKKLGKSQSFVANKLRLLKMDPASRHAIVKAGLSERHARAILRIEDPAARVKAIERIARGGLTVKESERLVDKLGSEARTAEKPVRRPRMIRIFKDYRVFINTVNSACDQLRESGLNVAVEQSELDKGVDIHIRVTQK